MISYNAMIEINFVEACSNKYWTPHESDDEEKLMSCQENVTLALALQVL
jgi:hypothetical protein